MRQIHGQSNNIIRVNQADDIEPAFVHGFRTKSPRDGPSDRGDAVRVAAYICCNQRCTFCRCVMSARLIARGTMVSGLLGE
jgi:hypothetical protein